MRDLLTEIDAALDVHLYQLALAGALAVPDIAAALESQTGETSRTRYVEWFDTHVGPKLVTQLGPLSGATCYRFRCSLLHQGSVEDQKEPLQFARLLFVDPRAPVYCHLNVINDVLNLDMRAFCTSITDAARAWLKKAAGAEPFETNIQRCVTYRPNGLDPFIKGVPVIG